LLTWKNPASVASVALERPTPRARELEPPDT
jgi:hypothetical protein